MYKTITKIIFHCTKCKIEIMNVDQILHDGMCTRCYLDEQQPNRKHRRTHMPTM